MLTRWLLYPYAPTLHCTKYHKIPVNGYKELEEQLRVSSAAPESPSADGPHVCVFFGGRMLNRSRTLRIPLSLPGD
jgi:hypothetical protein